MTHTKPHDLGAQPATAEELRKMTPEEAMYAGAESDDIHIVHRRDRFPIRGTKAEKRAERGVAAAFTIAGLGIGVFGTSVFLWQRHAVRRGARGAQSGLR